MGLRNINGTRLTDLRNIKGSQLTRLSPTGMLVKQKSWSNMNPRFPILTCAKRVTVGLSVLTYLCNHGNNSWSNSNNKTPEHSHSGQWCYSVCPKPQTKTSQDDSIFKVNMKIPDAYLVSDTGFCTVAGQLYSSSMLPMRPALWELWNLRLKQTSLRHFTCISEIHR